jgi:LmbE family N-acetylglucosaminyl deacetylase
MIIDVSQFMSKKLEAVAAHKTQTRVLDYGRAVESLDSHRAAMSTLKGYCEAFLILSRADFPQDIQVMNGVRAIIWEACT